MAAVEAMYARFSKGNFRKTGALSALKCGYFTLPFDVISLKNGRFEGVSCSLRCIRHESFYFNFSKFSKACLLGVKHGLKPEDFFFKRKCMFSFS